MFVSPPSVSGASLTGDASCEDNYEIEFFLTSLLLFTAFLLGDLLLLLRSGGPAEPFARTGVGFGAFIPFSLNSLNFLMYLRR